MIKNIIEFSIKNRALVVLFFILTAIASVYSFKTARVDAIPDIGDNQQIVFTKWPGRSPKDVEAQLTYPLSSHLQGIPGVKNVRSMSAFGFSSVSVIFEDDVDFYWSRTRILEKLASVDTIIPKGAKAQLGPDATGLGQIYWYTLENEKGAKNPLSLAQLRSLQDFYVKYLLQGTKGVSEVASIGGFVKEYQIDVDPKKLFAFDVHFSSLIKSIEKSNIDVGAEVVEDGEREFIVRGKGFFKSLSDIENVVIAVKNNTPIRIKDVASVGTGAAFRRGALDKNGVEAVGGVITMRFGENPHEVITGVKKQLEVIKRGLPKGVVFKPFYDRTELIENTLGTVYKALSEEMIITIVIIMLFLLHLRSSILVALTLPFGVGISFIFMKLFHIDSNVMSLSGLVIAIGSMVDTGIIMTENIYSHLASRPQAKGKERIDLIIKASKEVGPAVLTAVLTTMITFIPVFALTGAEGKLFTPLAWAKTLAMFGAVFVSLLLVPALSVYLLKGKLKNREENKFSKLIIRSYEPSLRWVLNNAKIFLIFPLIIMIWGAFSYKNLGREFMPSLNEGDILYMPVTTADVSLTKARELLSYTDEVLSAHPLVEYSVGKLGRAETAIDPAPVAMFETVIKLVPQDKWPSGMSIYDIMQELDKELQIPGLVNSWDFPIQTRTGMISTGIKTQVGIKIFGPKVEVLEKVGKEIAAKIKEVKGSSGVYAEQLTGKPYIEFDIDRVAASRFGINSGDVNNILQTAVGGMSIGQFYEGRERYPIRLRYKKELRDRIDELKNVLVPSPLGQHIPLSQLADIKIVTGPAVIQSENGLLRSVVQFNIKDRDLIGFVEEAKKYIDENVELPKGVTLSWAGQYEKEVRSTKQLMILVPIALIINLIIIYLGIRNVNYTLIILSAVPIAMSGGLILLDILSINLSVAVWVGFIALFGIAVDDGVVMMTYLKQKIKEINPTNKSELMECIVEAGKRRIRPLFMTTTTTVFALLPVMWSTSTGSEIMKPMAIPTLGGMVFEGITLFVVPVVFYLIESKKFKGVIND